MNPQEWTRHPRQIGTIPAAPGFCIRPADESDTEAIAQLATELGYPVDERAMRARLRLILNGNSDRVFVAVDCVGNVIGWLQAHAEYILESGFRIEIVGLIVSATARRRGAGRTLVAEAERWAGSLGAEVIVVRSNVQRAESHAFYPALGYVRSKTQTVYRKQLPIPPAT